MRTPTDDRQGATVVIRMIAKDLRINPLRTSLTALSMFIGIIALIAGVLVGTLGRDYLEAVNARLGGKSPTYSAIVDVPSSVNIQVVTALQERLAHFRPGIASAQYHLNDLAIWASSDDGNTEIRRVTIIITDAERTRIMPAPIIEGTWLTGADEPATLETAVNESARQYVHDGTVALARTGNPQQVPARVNGVIADGTDTPTIYVNATTLQRYWPQAWEPDGLTILVHPNEGVDDQHAKTVFKFGIGGANMPTRTPIPVSRAMRQISANLDLARRQQRIPVALLAERAGLSMPTVTKMLRTGNGSFENFLRIARLLGLLDGVQQATDPLNTDIGKLRADEDTPKRIR